MTKVTLRVQTAGRTHEYTYETIGLPVLPIVTYSSKEKEKGPSSTTHSGIPAIKQLEHVKGPIGPSPHCQFGRGRVYRKKTGKFPRGCNKNFSPYQDLFMNIFP